MDEYSEGPSAGFALIKDSNAGIDESAKSARLLTARFGVLRAWRDWQPVAAGALV